MTLATTGTDCPTQRTLDDFTRLAGRRLGVPVVYVSLVAGRGRMVASSYGRPVSLALLLCYPFCRHIAASRRPLVVADARRHPLTARTPAVRDGLVTAYAGVPLIDAAGRDARRPGNPVPRAAAAAPVREPAAGPRRAAAPDLPHSKRAARGP